MNLKEFYEFSGIQIIVCSHAHTVTVKVFLWMNSVATMPETNDGKVINHFTSGAKKGNEARKIKIRKGIENWKDHAGLGMKGGRGKGRKGNVQNEARENLLRRMHLFTAPRENTRTGWEGCGPWTDIHLADLRPRKFSRGRVSVGRHAKATTLPLRTVIFSEII